jgi:hypothetical protein
MDRRRSESSKIEFVLQMLFGSVLKSEFGSFFKTVETGGHEMSLGQVDF